MTQAELIERALRTVKTVATIGAKASGPSSGAAYRIPSWMIEAGYRVIPVNPTIESAFGERARKSLAEVGEPIDMVQVFRRGEHLAGIADEILALPEELRPWVVWLQLGIYDDQAVARLRASGIEVVEDRCVTIELAKYGGVRPHA